MAKTRRSHRRLDDLVDRSGFIFTGIVRRTAAATMPRVTTSDRTAVVQVQEVLRVPRVLGDYTEKQVTVLLQKATSAKRGERTVFFTTSWMFGEGLAVTEVGTMKPEDGLRGRIADAEARLADRALQARIERASVIVTGKVLRTRPLEKKTRFVSEHDPKWWEASVEIESIEKGRHKEDTIPVLFPSSDDEMWIDSPKFREGQEGVWILQRNQQERGAPVFRVPGYTALDPLDYRARVERDRVIKLIPTKR
jgi:hypothetical protein